MKFGFVLYSEGENVNRKNFRDLLAEDVTILEEKEETVESFDFIRGTVTICSFVLQGSLADFLKIKHKYNCRQEEPFVLYPQLLGVTC